MARLREQWLDALSTCVTLVLLALVYMVLAGYSSGSRVATHATYVTASDSGSH